MKEIHSLQMQILRKLLFADTLRYTDIKPDKDLENNKFDFHLDTLIKESLVEKVNGGYKLTSKGKEFANRMDTEDSKIKPQAKVGVAIICTKQIDNEQAFLIYTRLKQPFYGSQGFPSGKVAFGETTDQTAVRELLEETGLAGTPQLVQIRHYLVYDKTTNDLLEDKFMLMYLFNEPEGKLIPENPEGKYIWIKDSYLKDYVTNHFESWEGFQEQLNEIKNFTGQLSFTEIKHWTEKF